MKKLLALFCIIAIGANAQKFDPQNTYVFVVGVLKWQDSKSLPSFSDVHRKDLELKDQLLKMGIPAKNITSLTDNQATLAAIQKGFKTASAKCTDKSTFIFYYAGHGIKKEKEYYFANYDIDCNHCKKTGFGLSYLSNDLLSINKSSTIMLWADCCYSGALLEQGKNIKAAGRNCLVFSSATASNTSTGNWTFTQTLLDCFRGEKMDDQNQDGSINTYDIRLSLQRAMKYREHQMGGYYSSFEKEYLFVEGKKQNPSHIPTKDNGMEAGDYVFGFYEGKWKPVQIVKEQNNVYTVRFYFYSDYKDVDLTKEKIKPLYFTQHKEGANVKVLWEGKKYNAKIMKAENDFYYITYEGYDSSYDEWVMYDRIYTGNETTAQIEEHGSWYPGQVMEEKDGKYFIRYDGYDFSWDEWVGNNRIKK